VHPSRSAAPSRSPASAPVVLATLLAAAAGCSVRDERVVGSGDATWWSTATSESPGGLIGGSPARVPASATIEYEEGFAAAARRAAEMRAPTLLVFRATWCRWSSDLLSAAEADPRIVARARHCVCVAVDADRDADTCTRFAVRAFPTVILLGADGDERFRGTGSSAIGQLADALDDVFDTTSKRRRLAAGQTPSRR